MRQPTFDRKRRARQQRLLRTGIGVVVVVGLAAVAASLFAGGDPDEPALPVPEVAFTGSVRAQSDAGGLASAKKVVSTRVRNEQRELTDLLEEWYQRTFVDPSAFEPAPEDENGIEAWPPPDLLQLFSAEARASAATDADALTLGSERQTFARVQPTRTKADLTIYFRRARQPSLAVARVIFEATGTFKDATAFPVTIVHHATFHFAREGSTWSIVFYDADQEQDSILPPPTESPPA